MQAKLNTLMRDWDRGTGVKLEQDGFFELQLL